MSMNQAGSSVHRATLTISAREVQPGYTAHLRWKVVGVKANVASIHLASRIDSGPCIIERILAEGSRELLLTEEGTFVFTLTATFGDGIRVSREATVRVRTSS
jgi:hypothetical protein